MLASKTSDHAALLQALLDHLPVMALAVSTDGLIICCNQPVNSACGWTSNEASPHQLSEVIPADAAATLLTTPEGVVVRASMHGSSTHGPAEMEWSCRRLPGPDREEKLLLLVGRDIRREMELENYIAENQWFETAGALSGGLAHDFNNVLASVLGLSEIVGLRLPPDSPLRQFTNKISQSIDRAKILVRRFSQFSRKPAFLAEPQPMGLVLDDLRQVLSGFLPGSVPLESSISADTPWCQADRHALSQIILNCANFFRTRLRDDGGSIELRSTSTIEDGHATVTLRGSGAGLTRINVDTLFNLRTERTASAYESGAGLFAARRVAVASDLKLSARRDDPRTITFELRLPVAPA